MTVIRFRVRVKDDDNHDKDRHGGYDDNGEYGIDDEREGVHQEALRGGGWCLEWLHPPPKGIQR